MKNLSEDWLHIQLTHDVSASAANSYWKLALASFPALQAAKENSDVRKNTPGFEHLRRKLYSESCPEVTMNFCFLNKNTSEIEKVTCQKSPAKRFPKSKYIKLYEEAHIKVIFPFL